MAETDGSEALRSALQYLESAHSDLETAERAIGDEDVETPKRHITAAMQQVRSLLEKP